VIDTLTGGLVHQTAAGLVHRHRNAGNGRCASCGQPSPYPIRESASRNCLHPRNRPEAPRSEVAWPLTYEARDPLGPWRAPDSSGRAVKISQPTEGPARTQETYPSGQAPVGALRLATDPGLLAAQFGSIQPIEESPQFYRRAWAEVNAW
jgi:hypothetical protein